MASNRDWHLISLNNITPESNIKVMKIKEMIINLLKKLLIVKTNSPCQHFKKCIVNSMEKMHTYVRVKNGKSIYLFIYLFNNFIGYVYKLKMNTYTRKETKNG